MRKESNDNSDEIVLVCGADDAYAMPLATMLASVFVNCPEGRKLSVYIFDNGISGRGKSVIRGICKGNHQWLNPDPELLSDLKTTAHLTDSAYLRLLIPRELPRNIDRVIYLDADLIVECNIANLWQVDIEDYIIGAVQDMSIPYVSDPRGLPSYKEMGLDERHPYFNSGVLLINLQQWRDRSITDRVIKYLKENEKEIQFLDQDGLNAVLCDGWKNVDRSWNVPPKIKNFESWEKTSFKERIRDDVGRLQRGPCIIHYIGGEKPWMYGAEVPWQGRYFHYLCKSGWFSNKWDRKRWRLQEVLNHYCRSLNATFHQVLSETKRYLVPIARFLGVARSSRG